MMIAAGWRKIRKDTQGNKFVMFDQGSYEIPDKAQIEKDGGDEWVWCEAHVESDRDNKTYAEIGGKRVPLAVDPDLPEDD